MTHKGRLSRSLPCSNLLLLCICIFTTCGGQLETHSQLNSALYFQSNPGSHTHTHTHIIEPLISCSPVLRGRGPSRPEATADGVLLLVKVPAPRCSAVVKQAAVHIKCSGIMKHWFLYFLTRERWKSGLNKHFSLPESTFPPRFFSLRETRTFQRSGWTHSTLLSQKPGLEKEIHVMYFLPKTSFFTF